MSPRGAEALADRLGERDVAVLADLERFRLLTTRHLQRLRFADHASSLAAARACNRAMLRLRELGLVNALERRVGGVRMGSASYVWQLAATGERFLRTTTGRAHRRRFVEPGAYFVNHTLAVADVAVSLIERARSIEGFDVEHIGTEPHNWRRYLGLAGETQWLKPDLHVVTVHDGQPNGDGDGFEEHAFLEIDLGTEHAPRIQAKCRTYAAYAATGAYQAEHGLVPTVVWLNPNPARRAVLRAAVAATHGLPPGAFRVASPEAYLRDLGHGNSGESDTSPDPR